MPRDRRLSWEGLWTESLVRRRLWRLGLLAEHGGPACV